jgi:hypothetical protein
MYILQWFGGRGRRKSLSTHARTGPRSPKKISWKQYVRHERKKENKTRSSRASVESVEQVLLPALDQMVIEKRSMKELKRRLLVLDVV